jgi:hypothetical protein
MGAWKDIVRDVKSGVSLVQSAVVENPTVSDLNDKTILIPLIVKLLIS